MEDNVKKSIFFLISWLNRIYVSWWLWNTMIHLVNSGLQWHPIQAYNLKHNWPKSVRSQNKGQQLQFQAWVLHIGHEQEISSLCSATLEQVRRETVDSPSLGQLQKWWLTSSRTSDNLALHRSLDYEVFREPFQPVFLWSLTLQKFFF